MSGLPCRHTPRSAAVLLTRALDEVDRIEPEIARGPVRAMFQAAIELCASSRSLLGKRVVNVLDLAQALVSDDQPPKEQT